ncbi:hypothetical protein LPJGGPFB_06569 [Ensifer adhaerens]|nr:hypothetical protein [Ensifer adhaerens]
MPDFVSHLLIFFSPDHPTRTIVAGALMVWLGMAIYYIATRRRGTSVALKALGVAVALYGGGHASAALMLLSGAGTT